jgi:hypothetical protein
MKKEPPIPLEWVAELVREGADVIRQTVSLIEHPNQGGDIEAALVRSRAVLRSLADANSAFPETQAFLHNRGFSHVSELDRQGRYELREYLLGTLTALSDPIQGSA